MTEEEVQLIYDYLHENYDYRDGELIAKNNSGRRVKGEKCGYFHYSSDYPEIKMRIKNKGFNLSKLIYIYHFKTNPTTLEHLDGNIANNKIENLNQISRSVAIANKATDKYKGYQEVIVSGKRRFSVRLNIDGRLISFGTYGTKEEAREIYLKIKKIYLSGVSNLEELKNEARKLNPKIKSSITNKFNFPGVHFNRGKYYGRFSINKKRIITSAYCSPEEAHAAYLKAKEEYANQAT